MITELKNLKKGQHFHIKEVNGQKTKDTKTYEYIKVSCGWWLVFGKPKDKKKYRDLWQYTMKDQVKVEVLTKQGELFK